MKEETEIFKIQCSNMDLLETMLQKKFHIGVYHIYMIHTNVFKYFVLKISLKSVFSQFKSQVRRQNENMKASISSETFSQHIPGKNSAKEIKCPWKVSQKKKKSFVRNHLYHSCIKLSHTVSVV